MANVITNLLNSEKGVMGLALLIAASVLAAMGTIDAVAWINYTQWIFGIYAGSKAIQGAASAIANRPATPAAQPVATSNTTVVTQSAKDGE